MTGEVQGTAIARLVGGRAIVWDPKDGMQLYDNGYFGQPVGIRKPKSPVFDKPLELSLLECAYLTREKKLQVLDSKDDRILSLRKIMNLGSKRSKDFKDQFLVYAQLRELGYVVRPGLKFGTDFAVYEKGPGLDHAPFLVHVIPQKNGVVPLDIVRAGRLATSVRKRFIIATVKASGEIAHYSFVWHRP
ncbi:MAG: tRNA-intron lyase [Candidatus Thorarchaeota archaeon]|nr:MAG: tRNA-intron lyase [Candidatus Thorarchaeota archaeon]